MDTRWLVGRAWRLPTFLALVCAVGLIACAPKAPPTLSAAVPDGAREVRLDDPLEVVATGAVLDEVTLTRLDQAAAAPAFQLDGTRAQLAAALAPDAHYRLVARATGLDEGLRPPWQPVPPAALHLEREFWTVRAPRLVAPADDAVLTRDATLELRFSEPLAAARLVEAPAGAVGQVAPDPHVFRVRFAELAPGATYTLRIGDVVGRNGAPGPEQRVTVRTPAAPELVAVNAAPLAERVVVPPDTPLALEWATPLGSLRYRLGAAEATWTGGPTTRVELADRLAPGEASTFEVLDAVDDQGGWLASPLAFEVATPPPLRLAAVWPADGATGVTPRADPTFRFSEPVQTREAVEQAITFEPAVPGRFEWLSPERVRFVPEEAFPRESEVRVRIASGPEGLRGASGSYLAADVNLVFHTGKLKVIHVWLSTQRLALYEDDQEVFSAPVATGVRGAETPTGTYEVLYKMPVARFRGVNPNGTRYDIPDVKWVLAFYGDYTIHGAYWRRVFGTPGSAGCISLTDANAKVVYDWADVGTPIVIHR